MSAAGKPHYRFRQIELWRNDHKRQSDQKPPDKLRPAVHCLHPKADSTPGQIVSVNSINSGQLKSTNGEELKFSNFNIL